MARTKQTARRSSNVSFSGDSQSVQVDIFKATAKRTIVVEGRAEFWETPDLIHLSFLIEESASSLAAGIKKTIAKLADVRAIITGCGVPNDSISSDSIGSSVEHTEYGKYHTEGATKTFKCTAYRVTYKMKSVVRVCLEGQEADNIFSKVAFAAMSAGIRMYNAPLYDSTKLTFYRNQARKEAAENAKKKAQCIVDALGVRLGDPITLTDLHCDIQDDARDSFLGNIDNSIYNPPKRIIADDKDKEDDEKVPGQKRQKYEVDDGDKQMDDASKSSSLDEALAEQIFVVTPIKILASVKAIYEIVA